MHYDADGAPLGVNVRFTATAAADGTVKVPYTLVGPARVVQRERDHGEVRQRHRDRPSSAPDPRLLHHPSNGFLYGGVESFDVQAGDTYGFS